MLFVRPGEMGGDAMRPVSINKGELYKYPKAPYENHSVNQDEKTQREGLNKAPYDAEYLLHAGGAKVCSSGS